MDDFNLDDVLNESAAPVEQVEPEQPQEAPQEAEVQEGPQRDEKGRFAPKGEQGDAPPASDDKSKGLEAGISAERKKRQEAEGQIEQLRRELEQLRASAQPPEPPPSIWDDDEAALSHLRNDAVSAAVSQASFNAKLDMSEMMARQAHDDFDEAKAEFLQMMQENPALQQQALSDPHPWQKAYQIVTNARTMKELGATNLDEMKAKLLEQLKAEQAQQAVTPSLPNSLADAQSSKGERTSPVTQPLTLEEILGR